MTKTFKPLPDFADEAEENAFWQTHDSADYFDLSKAQKAVFANLKPSTKTISLRLPEMLLDDIKQLANRRDVPYQSLMKMMLADAVAQTRAHSDR